MAHEMVAQCTNCNRWCVVPALPALFIAGLLMDKATHALGLEVANGAVFPVICQKEKTIVYVKTGR